MAHSRIIRAILSGVHGSNPNGTLDRLILMREDGTPIDPATLSIGPDAPTASPGVILSWAPATVYKQGQPVIQGNVVYTRNADGTSRATFDATEQALWTPLPVGGSGVILPWSANTVYKQGQPMIQAGTLYTRNANGTSGSTFDSTEQSAWTPLPVGDTTAILPWTASRVYKQGQPMIQAGTLYTRNADGTARATFDATELAAWTPLPVGDITAILPWAATTAYKQGQPMIQGGVVYTRNVDGTSRATFDATELATWTPLPVVRSATILKNYQTANYVVQASDAGKTIEMDIPAGQLGLVTVNTGVMPTDSYFGIDAVGSGAVKIVLGSGVTQVPNGSRFTLAGQGVSAYMRHRGGDNWMLGGELV